MKLDWKGISFLLLFPFYAFSEPGPYFRFIENKNQWSPSVDFAARVPGGNVSVSSEGFSYTLLDYEKLEAIHQHSHYRNQNPEIDGSCSWVNGYSLTANFVGSNTFSTAKPFGKQDAYYSFFIGNDSSHWASHANAFD